MNPDVKRRIVMSLVSLALAFGLLATYYIVTVPWDRTTVGQALTAGAALGIAAIVVQFIPIRTPVPAVSAPTPAPEPTPRSWQPEPDFGADDFATDLATQPSAAAETLPAFPTINVPAMPSTAFAGPTQPTATAMDAPEPQEIHVIVSPPLPPPPSPVKEPDPIVPREPQPTPSEPGFGAAEPLVTAIEANDASAETEVLTMGEIKETLDVLHVRNDHVRIESEQAPPAPVAAPLGPGARTILVRPMSTSVSKFAPRKLPTLSAPASEWREPDPEAPKELLRELAEYWHVKYETEKKRHTEMSTQYEDMLRRLEILEKQAATESPPRRAKKIDPAAPTMDGLNVEDSARKENGEDLEERWDQRATEIEHFH